jgi:hypothetical protein
MINYIFGSLIMNKEEITDFPLISKDGLVAIVLTFAAVAASALLPIWDTPTQQSAAKVIQTPSPASAPNRHFV